MTDTVKPEQIRSILHELSVPIHQGGYRKLCLAIPCFAADPEQGLIKGVYPFVSQELGCTGSVEASIRRTIRHAWDHGNRAAWGKYFPDQQKAPSNLVFIATLAEYLA